MAGGPGAALARRRAVGLVVLHVVILFVFVLVFLALALRVLVLGLGRDVVERDDVVLLHRLLHRAVARDLGQVVLVDGLARLLLLERLEYAVVQVVVEVLGVTEHGRARRALARRVARLAARAFLEGRAAGLFAAVGWRLLHAVHRREVPLEHIGAVEALFSGRAAVGAEVAHHGALVMRERVPAAIVLPREAFDVIRTRHDRALFGALRLVREHVGFQIADDTAAVDIWTPALLLALFVDSHARARAVGAVRASGHNRVSPIDRIGRVWVVAGRWMAANGFQERAVVVM